MGLPSTVARQFGLPLRHHVPGRQADRGQVPALPDPGRDTCLVLGGAQRRARPAVAVTDTEEIAPVAGTDLRLADHRHIKHWG